MDSRVAAIDHDALRWSGTADCASRERDEEAETPRDEGWKEGRGRQTRRPCPQLRTGYVKQAAGVGLTCLHLSTSSCCIQGCPLPPPRLSLNASFSGPATSAFPIESSIKASHYVSHGRPCPIFFPPNVAPPLSRGLSFLPILCLENFRFIRAECF